MSVNLLEIGSWEVAVVKLEAGVSVKDYEGLFLTQLALFYNGVRKR